MCFHIQVAAALMRPPPAVQEESHNMRGRLKVNVHDEREDQDGGDSLKVKMHDEQQCQVDRDSLSVNVHDEQEGEADKQIPVANRSEQFPSKLDLLRNLSFILYFLTIGTLTYHC